MKRRRKGRRKRRDKRRKRKMRRRNDFVLSTNVRNNQGEVKANIKWEHNSYLSHMAGRGPITSAIICCLLRSIPEGS